MANFISNYWDEDRILGMRKRREREKRED